MVDTQGSFLRPAFYFMLDASYPGYRITATVAGDDGDFASASIPSARPRLFFACAHSSASEIACQLSGKGFVPMEGITVAYTVIAPDTTGVTQTNVYRRQGTTDSAGAFERPTLTFDIQASSNKYAVMVVVVGKSGDRASAQATGITPHGPVWG